MQFRIVDSQKRCICCNKGMKIGAVGFAHSYNRGLTCKKCITEIIPEKFIEFENKNKDTINKILDKHKDESFTKNLCKELRRLLVRDLRKEGVKCKLTHSGSDTSKWYTIRLSDTMTITLHADKPIECMKYHDRAVYSWVFDQKQFDNNDRRLFIPLHVPYNEALNQILEWYKKHKGKNRDY